MWVWPLNKDIHKQKIYVWNKYNYETIHLTWIVVTITTGNKESSNEIENTVKDDIIHTIEALPDNNLKKRKITVCEQRIELQAMENARIVMGEYLNPLPVCKNGESWLVSNICVLINRKERRMKK